MREHNASEIRSKQSKCYYDHEQNSRMNRGVAGNPPLKPKSNSLWGSNLVKGFSMEKKSKQINSIANKNNAPLACQGTNSGLQYNSRVKRSLITDFPCSANTSQVHPNVFNRQRVTSPSSRNLFSEIDNLRTSLRESKEIEHALRSELQEYKESSRVLELERELNVKKAEIENLNRRVGMLETEKTSVSERLASSAIEQPIFYNNTSDFGKKLTEGNKDFGFEVLQLRRLNKELQLQKRNLSFRLSTTESKLATLMKFDESDIVAKVKEEASLLRHENENLSKQVEGLQMRRLSEVEELAYLRWVNSCMRQELYNPENTTKQDMDSDDDGSGLSCVDYELIEGGTDQKNFKSSPSKSPSFSELSSKISLHHAISEETSDHDIEGGSVLRRHSISGSKSCLEDLSINKRRQSDGFVNHEVLNDGFKVKVATKSLFQKDDSSLDQRIQSPRLIVGKQGTCKPVTFNIGSRTLRVPNPPPRPSNRASNATKTGGPAPVPPPPPPPPPLSNCLARKTGVMQRAPQVVELYHSLMKRDSRRDASGGGVCDLPNVANVRSSMIGEIENRSSHLLAIKADVETQGEFVRSLIKEVNNAAFSDIEDVVAFVKWLDDELCFLVDERAVLKHFDWPEKKADTLREAAFGYRHLKKLELEVSDYEDDPRVPCEIALKKLVALSERTERSVYNLLQTREILIRHCKDFHIPIDWMLDSGIISKIKFASVNLAMKYMKRVARELQAMGGALDKDPALEYMLLQGVRFAFRIHQFAGGFNAETMSAFEELRNLAHVRKKL